MKNLFFGLGLLLVCSSFTMSDAINNTEKDGTITDTISIVEDIDDVRCRWRTCTYVNGVLQGCTEWTYGECTINSDGTITHE